MLYIAETKHMCFVSAMYNIFHINSYFKFIYKDLSSNFFNNGERCPGKCATPSTKIAY